MIPLKVFTKGFVSLNLYLTSAYILIYWFLTIKWHSPTILLKINILIYFIGLIFIPQIILWLNTIILAKGWDCVFLKLKIHSKELTVKGTLFGVLSSSTLATIWVNLCIDHLFQFKKGHYTMALAPFFLCLLYYGSCCFLGLRLNRSKIT